MDSAREGPVLFLEPRQSYNLRPIHKGSILLVFQCNNTDLKADVQFSQALW